MFEARRARKRESILIPVIISHTEIKWLKIMYNRKTKIVYFIDQGMFNL